MSQQLLTAENPEDAKRLSRLFLENKLRRIYAGIYTSNLNDPIEEVVKSNWMDIAAKVVPDGILSYRTAIELKPISSQGKNIIFMTSSYWRTIEIPGLTISLIKGDGEQGCVRITKNLSASSRARALLENLSAPRTKAFKEIKTIGAAGVESILAKELRLRKETGLNQLRDEAKEIAEQLGLTREFKKLNEMIGALLSSQSVEKLQTKYAKVMVEKKPFDSTRIQLFQNLSLYLRQCQFKLRTFDFSLIAFKNLSFFEAYFSNFIEGTEFLIDEAEDIVFSGKEIANRHADSHDVLASFYLSNDYSEMTQTPNDTNELLEILKQRHAYIMKERVEKNPGQFKDKPNKAGNTYFVEPQDVVGTLTEGFEIYQLLDEGLPRALFIHFLISEVHPFQDGNGRMARIMMNAELVKANLCKIMIPTVHRDNYLNGLRRASRDQFFQTYCKVMDQAQAYTASFDWLDYIAARQKIEKDHADRTSDEGLPIFNRALRLLSLSDFS